MKGQSKHDPRVSAVPAPPELGEIRDGYVCGLKVYERGPGDPPGNCFAWFCERCRALNGEPHATDCPRAVPAPRETTITEQGWALRRRRDGAWFSWADEICSIGGTPIWTDKADALASLGDLYEPVYLSRTVTVRVIEAPE